METIINNLVAYDSELDYNTSEKIPTVLSTNPCQYEKRLRKIVLDLYSDKEPYVLGDVYSMEQNTRVHISAVVPTPSYDIVKQQRGTDYIASQSLQGPYLSDEVKSPAILYRYEETALTNEGPDYNISDLTHNLSPLPIKTVPYLVDGKTMATGIDHGVSYMDLQQSLDGIDASSGDDEEMTHFCHGSTESEHARSFSDSGIQLESELDEKSLTYGDEYSFKQRNDLTQRNSVATDSTVINYDKEFSGQSHDPALKPLVLGYKSSSTILRRDNQLKQTTSTTNQDKNKLTEEESEYKLQLANMRGKLETITTEYTEVLEERKQLSDKLKMYENTALKEDVDGRSHSKLQQEIVLLREKEQNLEKTLAMLQRTNDDKDIKVKDVEEKLSASLLNVQNLQENLNALEEEMLSKSSGVEILKRELNELTCALEESRACYQKSYQENCTLSSDVSTLMKAKSFLMKQLDASKNSQQKLQSELMEYHSAFLAQNKQVEELKCDNAKVVQKLSQTQENGIKEKAVILEHLEKVEKDLVSQDETLRKMQTEKITIQRELGAKINALQEENNLLQNLTKPAQKVSEELNALKIDAQAKESLLNQLSTEKEEISKQLAQATNVNESCEQNIRSLNSQLKANESKLESLANEQERKDNIIAELERKNAFLTESIQDAQEEKDGLDAAVQMLRLELDKVERRFKMMKRELAVKSIQLEEVTKQKDTFISELSFLREELEHHKTLMEDLRETIQRRDETIRALQADKAKMQEEARALSEHLKQSKLDFDEAIKEKELMYEKLQTSNGMLVKAERKFYESCSEKAMLEGELESSKQALQDHTAIKQAEQQMLKHEMDQLQSAFQYETTRHRDEAINLKQEVDLMKGKLVEQSLQYKMNVENLQKKLANVEATQQAETKNTKKHYDNLVKEISKNAETERKEKNQEITTLSEEKQSLAFKCTELEEKARRTASLQQDRISALQQELQTARKVIDEQKKDIEKQRMLSVELEREKGRLAGLKTSQQALRQHCVNVELSSAKANSKISELQSQLDLASLEREREGKESISKVNMLETTVKTQRERIEELRRHLASERTESSQLKVKLNTSELEAENVLKKLTKTCIELEHVNASYENCAKELQDSKKQEREYHERVQNSKMLVQKLENDTKLLKERENVKDDSLKNLEWKVSQRSKELEYAKEQLRLSNERRQSEIETLKTAIQVGNSEAVYLRKEVSMARKAKTENQENYFKARDELVAAKQETEVTKQDLFAATQQLRYLKSAILNSLDLTELQEFVKHEDETRLLVSKVTFTEPAVYDTEFTSSLSSLRECMTSLRNQISTLQEQMNSHTSMIWKSETSWKSFEKNVQTLQLECAAVQGKAHFLPPGKDVKDFDTS